jgi:hypothetical protein
VVGRGKSRLPDGDDSLEQEKKSGEGTATITWETSYRTVVLNQTLRARTEIYSSKRGNVKFQPKSMRVMKKFRGANHVSINNVLYY